MILAVSIFAYNLITAGCRSFVVKQRKLETAFFIDKFSI
nr:MAG TPA: hypothetical protein [Caudoviricetes sp.]